jgi:hypothetical protein
MKKLLVILVMGLIGVTVNAQKLDVRMKIDFTDALSIYNNSGGKLYRTEVLSISPDLEVFDGFGKDVIVKSDYYFTVSYIKIRIVQYNRFTGEDLADRVVELHNLNTLSLPFDGTYFVYNYPHTLRLFPKAALQDLN